MSKPHLNKLSRLGYQFWVPKNLLQDKPNQDFIFYLLDKKALFSATAKELHDYPRFLDSIRKILGLTKKEVVQIDKEEALLMQYDLVIDFSQQGLFKASKTIKFDSIGLLTKNKELKEDLYTELIN